jgi:hypothetical protein
MVPADQGLDADQPATGDLDLRLIVENELLALHRVPEFPFERLLMLELNIELFLEQPVATATE